MCERLVISVRALTLGDSSHPLRMFLTTSATLKRKAGQQKRKGTALTYKRLERTRHNCTFIRSCMGQVAQAQRYVASIAQDSGIEKNATVISLHLDPSRPFSSCLFSGAGYAGE